MNRKTILICALCTQLSAFGGTDLVNPHHGNALSDSSRVVDLDEVVVISQPKEQMLLRQQPLSSTVLTSGEISRFQIRDLTDLSAAVPSFAMPAYGSRLTSSIYVRGIGSRLNNPAVAIYQDGIPLMTKSAFNTHFYQLERVDVLRGPQSTLYGQNSEGGLVRVYSKNPFTYQGTDVRLGIGNGLYTNFEAATYQRLSDQFAFSAAGFYTGLKGFINNTQFSEKNDKSNEAGGRLRMLWKPTTRLGFDLSVDYQHVNQNGFGYGLVADDNTVSDPSTTIMNGYKRQLLTTGLTLSYEMPNLLLTSTSSWQHLYDQMDMDQDYLPQDFLRLQQRQKMNTITEELVLRSRGDRQWQHSSGLFAAYQWLRTDAPVSFGDGITGPIATAVKNAMVGAMKQGMIPQMMAEMMAKGMPEAVARAAAEKAAEQATAGVTMSAEMAVPETFQTPMYNLGVFHESTFRLADRLRLTLGLRLNVDHVEIDYDALAYMNMTGGVGERVATYRLTSHVIDQRSKTYVQLLPKVGLTWQLSEQLGNVFATFSKGYRAGGYNIQIFSDILQPELMANSQKAMRGDYDVPHTPEQYDEIAEAISYKPEESWNVEGGVHLNLFGGALHADASVYYMFIRNQQLSQMTPLSNYGRMMTNAGRSHSLGFEMALRGAAFDNRLDWSATYGFTSAKFDEYTSTVSQGSTADPTTDYAGMYVPFVPQHTLNLTADYHLNDLTLGLNIYGQSKTWWDEANSFYDDAYAVLGAHVDYNFGPVLVSLWGRNLTDNKYNTFAVKSSAAGKAAIFAQRAQPLQFGLDVRMHF